ncbi:nucleotidyltransferase substrate binding protein, HI0074 family [Ruminococcus sp. YE71]|uniref:HI0074 family nucleotidyltransferase substrate-binding subunit n=1 Tax=unclassified Ruminococcus TaxID=2608920 RepID=UPI00088005DD|nr:MULTISPECIES: HI0074 family nucleotidyltransferase substrate-binding subunit [unclassified Ruminococcus]SDA30787.1 nucleotidyltransferase substrate binding protein, HI0074 family [Ruminococcus sp. YE78]SFW50436.1 nucleotidyltransferase substrate binding protein, HI0074 family [Ruminococcus sp. YE71]
MKKYENFCKALGNLKIGTQLEPPYTIVEQTGIVGLFEICFEQSWKLMKELLELHGRHEASSGSPRQIIKIAFQSGMITDEDAWLELLEVRNLLAHTYSDEQTLDSIRKIKADFVSVFEKLKNEIDDNWLL